MSPVTILSSDFGVRLKALSGQAGMHFGLPSHASQISGLRVVGCRVRAPYWQASMHQSQPLHLAMSTVTVPVCFDWLRASSGHAATQGALGQALQVIAVLFIWFTRTVRIRDLSGLKMPSFSKEQAYSQMSQPTHL